jgi:subtilase family serine protease
MILFSIMVGMINAKVLKMKGSKAAAGMPDLCIYGRVNISPVRPKMGENVVIKAAIRNCGDVPLPIQASLKLEINGPGGFNQVTKYFSIPILNPVSHGEPREFQFQYGYTFTKMGVYKTTITVDSSNVITEENETNNKKTRSFIVAPLPDLMVYIPVVKDVHVGRERTVTVELKNIGPGIAPPTRLNFYLEAEGTKWYDIPSLNPQQKIIFKRSHRYWVIGSKQYWARVDTLGQVQELNENNNMQNGSFKVYVGSHFDESGQLYPPRCLNISFSAPKKVKMFKKIAIVARVKNQYDRESAPVKMVFSVQNHPTVTFHIPELFPNQTHEIFHTVSWPTPGNKQFSARISSMDNCQPFTGSITVEELSVKH